MSEFKFLCPECGQKILGDANYSGTQVACPACQKNITVPATPSVPAATPVAGAASSSVPPRPSSIPPILPTTARSMPAAPAAASRPQQPPDHLSALAVASLICSVFVPLGSIPGIICGHQAKKRMRRNIFLVGERMANAGLLISYSVLVATLTLAGIFLLEHWYNHPVKVLRESPTALTALQWRVVDEVIMGENEDDHDVEGQMHHTTTSKGKPCHITNRGGSFNYTMKVLPDRKMTLNCRYSGDEKKNHEFDIAVDDQIIATQNLMAIAPDHFVDVEYKIPASLTRGKTQVKVEFLAHTGKMAGALYGCQILKR